MIVGMRVVLKRTVVDMLNYSHPGDHTRRYIDGLVFGKRHYVEIKKVILKKKVIDI